MALAPVIALGRERRAAIKAVFIERARAGLPPPSMLDISRLFGITLGKTVANHFDALVKQGFLRRDGCARAQRCYVLADQPLPPRSEWPLAAHVTAVIQRPGEVVFHYGDPTDWIPEPSHE